MWQEDFSHPLTRLLSWRACHLRLLELLATQEVTEEPQEPNVDDEEVFCLQISHLNLMPCCVYVEVMLELLCGSLVMRELRLAQCCSINAILLVGAWFGCYPSTNTLGHRTAIIC